MAPATAACNATTTTPAPSLTLREEFDDVDQPLFLSLGMNQPDAMTWDDRHTSYEIRRE
jgi:hypothetical protein